MPRHSRASIAEARSVWVCDICGKTDHDRDFIVNHEAKAHGIGIEVKPRKASSMSYSEQMKRLKKSMKVK